MLTWGFPSASPARSGDALGKATGRATGKQKAAIALMQARRQEDETDDPEEPAERDRDLEEFNANMNHWRAEKGRPPAY